MLPTYVRYGQALERIAQAVDLVQVLARQAGDEGAPVALPDHQALAFELAQRFANRSAADAEGLGERLLAQLLAGRELVAQDGFSQTLQDLVGQGAFGGRCQNVGEMVHEDSVLVRQRPPSLVVLQLTVYCYLPDNDQYIMI